MVSLNKRLIKPSMNEKTSPRVQCFPRHCARHRFGNHGGQFTTKELSHLNMAVSGSNGLNRGHYMTPIQTMHHYRGHPAIHLHCLIPCQIIQYFYPNALKFFQNKWNKKQERERGILPSIILHGSLHSSRLIDLTSRIEICRLVAVIGLTPLKVPCPTIMLSYWNQRCGYPNLSRCFWGVANLHTSWFLLVEDQHQHSFKKPTLFFYTGWSLHTQHCTLRTTLLQP